MAVNVLIAYYKRIKDRTLGPICSLTLGVRVAIMLSLLIAVHDKSRMAPSVIISILRLLKKRTCIQKLQH